MSAWFRDKDLAVAPKIVTVSVNHQNWILLCTELCTSLTLWNWTNQFSCRDTSFDTATFTITERKENTQMSDTVLRLDYIMFDLILPLWGFAWSRVHNKFM